MRIYHNESTYLDELAHECLIQTSAESVARKHLSIFFDLDVQIVNFDCTWLKSALQKVLTFAIDRSPECGEIQVTACCVDNAIELEVSDVGDTPREIATPAFQRRRETSVNSAKLRDIISSIKTLGADFWGVECPQGGMAWTLRMPRKMSAVRAA